MLYGTCSSIHGMLGRLQLTRPDPIAKCSHVKSRVIITNSCWKYNSSLLPVSAASRSRSSCRPARVAVQATSRRHAPVEKEAQLESESDAQSLPSTNTADFPELHEADIDQEYLEVPMHKCRFLMAINEDHLLLNDVRIMDDDSDDTCRALVDTSGGELPKEAFRYQFVPWMRHISGDALKYEEDEYQLSKIFLVKKKANSDMLDLDTVVCLDAEERCMGRVPVDRQCSADVPEDQLILRIREGSLILEPSQMAPPPGDIVGMHEYGSSPEDGAETEIPQLEAIPASAATTPEEMEDDMDVADDVPAVDLA